MVRGQGPVGFDAALLPYLERLGDRNLVKRFTSSLYAHWNPHTNLFGRHYYDNALALFALGFLDHLYAFREDGDLSVFWEKSGSSTS